MFSEKEGITIQFQETLKDIRTRLLGKYAMPKTRVQFLIVVILLTLFIESWITFLAFFNNFSIFYIVMLIYTPIINLMIFFLPEIITVRIKANKDFVGANNYLLEINQEGIQAQIGTQSWHLLWHYFKLVQEGKEYFFLLLPLNFVLSLPKRVFSTEQEEKFRALLNQNIDKKRLKLKSPEKKIGEKKK